MLDIWKPQIPQAQWHQNFSTMLKYSDPRVLEEIKRWTTKFIDRDNKIVKEFQSTFNSSFWEFYLCAALDEMGFSIDGNFDRPDFIDSTRKVSIEATIASNADGSIPEWKRNVGNLRIEEGEMENFLNESCVRFGNAFLSKFKKFKNGYSALPHVQGTAFGVAIHAFHDPLFWVANETPPLGMLYSFKQDKGFEVRDGLYQSTGFEKRLDTTGFFLDDDCKEISFVLYSTMATHSKATGVIEKDMSYVGKVSTLRYDMRGTEPYEETVPLAGYKEGLLEGLRVYHNPFASNPVDPSYFDHPGVAQYFFDVREERILKMGYHHGMLIQRVILRNMPE